MPVCGSCGQENRVEARFCWCCAAPLVQPSPNEADRQWLSATLACAEPDGPLVMTGLNAAPETPATGVTTAAGQPDAEEKTMEQPTPLLFAGRYELPADAADGNITVTDTAPWHRCWACGSTANESGDAFCNDCGAALTPRTYQATLTHRDAPMGAALLAPLSDDLIRTTLPAVTEQLEEGDRLLTIIHDSGRGPLTTPLDETSALAAGASLSHLLAALHNHELALGTVEPADLEAMPGGTVRLRSVKNLRHFNPDEREAAVQSDLTALAELLEQLTATPRTTQRLTEDEAEVAVASDEEGMATVLRQIRMGELTTVEALATRLEAILAERTHPLALRQLVGAATDTGMVRDHNEDSYLTLQLGLDNNNLTQGWGIYIVSDGMGGHAAGEVASGLAIRAAAELLLGEYLATAVQPNASYSEAEAKEIVRRAILAANERVVEESRSQGNDMGATFTMALVVGNRVLVGNIGDSRTYLYHEGKLRRISKDHSLVQRLVELGQISDDDVYTHPQRNAVLRSLGDRSELEVDLFSERVEPGDALFLCSDGQWEMTRDPAMEQLIANEAEPHAVCQSLIAAANQAGGEDNITAVLVRFL